MNATADWPPSTGANANPIPARYFARPIISTASHDHVGGGPDISATSAAVRKPAGVHDRPPMLATRLRGILSCFSFMLTACVPACKGKPRPWTTSPLQEWKHVTSVSAERAGV